MLQNAVDWQCAIPKFGDLFFISLYKNTLFAFETAAKAGFVLENAQLLNFHQTRFVPFNVKTKFARRGFLRFTSFRFYHVHKRQFGETTLLFICSGANRRIELTQSNMRKFENFEILFIILQLLTSEPCVVFYIVFICIDPLSVFCD